MISDFSVKCFINKPGKFREASIIILTSYDVGEYMQKLVIMCKPPSLDMGIFNHVYKIYIYIIIRVILQQ